MHKFSISLVIALSFLTAARSQTDSIVLRDLNWDEHTPAGMTELFIPSGNSMLAGFIYKANGAQKHPTLLLLHGYPGRTKIFRIECLL